MMTSTWHSLEAEADQIAIVTAQQVASTCTLLQDAISLLADGFNAVEGLPDNRVTQAQMGLLSQNFNSLKCSIDLAMRGYYTQSMSLLRGVYENWIAVNYIKQEPTKAELWLCANKRPPGHEQMLKVLKSLGDGFIEDANTAKEWYGMLCRFAHTDPHVVLPHLGSRNGEAFAFFGATYKPDLFGASASAISVFSMLMLREVSYLIPPDAAWMQHCGEMIKKLQRENGELLKPTASKNANESAVV